MPNIEISLAQQEDREECYRLIYEIFCDEMGIMRGDADHRNRIIRDHGLEVPHVLAARMDGQLAGTLGIIIGDGSLFPEQFERDYEIRRFLSVVSRNCMAFNLRFLVRPEYRSTPLPFRMIVEASRVQIERRVQLVFCFCQPHLLNLYGNLGFRPYAPLFEVTGFGIVVPLVMIVPDVEHMRAMRSPLVRYLPKHIEDRELAARIRTVLPESAPVAITSGLEGASWNEAYALLTRTRAPSGAFEGFSEAEISLILERSHTLECGEGQQIIVKGQDTRPAFVILEGAADVRIEGKTIARFEEGQLFGEFALLLHTRRTADVYASGKRVRLLELDERTLQRLLDTRPELTAKFLLNLSRSLALRLVSRNA